MYKRQYTPYVCNPPVGPDAQRAPGPTTHPDLVAQRAPAPAVSSGVALQAPELTTPYYEHTPTTPRWPATMTAEVQEQAAPIDGARLAPSTHATPTQARSTPLHHSPGPNPGTTHTLAPTSLGSHEPLVGNKAIVAMIAVVTMICATALFTSYTSFRHMRAPLHCGLEAIEDMLGAHVWPGEVAEWHRAFLFAIIKGTLSPSCYNSTRNGCTGGSIVTHKAHSLRKLMLRVMRPGNRHESGLHSCLYDRLASLSPRERDRIVTLCEEMTDPWKREAASAALIWDLQTKLGITPLSVQEIKAYLQWLVETNRVPSAAVPRTAIFHAHGLDHSSTNQYFYHALPITGGTNDACPMFELDGPHWSLEPTWVHAPRHTEGSALSSWTSIGFGCFGTDLQCPLVTILSMCRDSGMYDLNMNTMKMLYHKYLQAMQLSLIHI